MVLLISGKICRARRHGDGFIAEKLCSFHEEGLLQTRKLILHEERQPETKTYQQKKKSCTAFVQHYSYTCDPKAKYTP